MVKARDLGVKRDVQTQSTSKADIHKKGNTVRLVGFQGTRFLSINRTKPRLILKFTVINWTN